MCQYRIATNFLEMQNYKTWKIIFNHKMSPLDFTEIIDQGIYRYS